MSASSLQASYPTAEEAIEALNAQQAEKGFVAVKCGGGYSRRTGLRNNYRFQCQHSGSYRPNKNNSNIYKTSSRKGQCPFRAQIRLNTHDNTWTPIINESRHNHDPVPSPLDSSILRLRSQQNFGLQEIQTRVETLTNLKTFTTKQIAAQIMQQCPDVYITSMEVFFIQRQLRLSKSSEVENSTQTPAASATRAGPGRRGRAQRNTLPDLVSRVDALANILTSSQQAASSLQQQINALTNSLTTSQQATLSLQQHIHTLAKSQPSATTATQASQAEESNVAASQSTEVDLTGAAPMTPIPHQSFFGDQNNEASNQLEFVPYEPTA
ncbi:Transcription factor, FAR1-related protein [Metarhizium album ARSEF 1941]|uniref:Transcription factor, FAR1-related protein n=1 Tax=Metarhizium album (strain ARSEF 1941) TaxID=1081103 RepID=A0A0B2WHH9_METAS|nr:Transcription factor, FAR1-related protein [Metarhizium album ARSEF 1941]KHN95481.1 Transcription factor, FAR1-related protein [Metarhizium album ARSEF 1941]